jgi:hemerythrin-like domain-containing protein
MRFTEVIAQDQAAVRRGLTILDRMVQRLEEGHLIEIYDIRTVIRFLRVFGERYPHADVQELVGSIEASLSPKHGVGFVRSSRRLIHLLQNQIEQEQGEARTEDFPASPMLTETYADFSRLERKYAPKPRAVPIELDRRAHA